MFTTLFNKKPLLDESTRNWIFDTFSWAVTNFDLTTFQQSTQLVLPNNSFYSGRVSSVDEMAANIFNHTLDYAGMRNWPIKLVNSSKITTQTLPVLEVTSNLRGDDAIINVIGEDQSIELSFNPQQINQPQDLIASFVQQFATILVMQQSVLPPGGKECFPQAIDVLACVMGFGVIFANTAYQYKGGCGSCYNAMANRQAALPEYEMLYCLAVFSVVKNIESKAVVPHLKGHLRSNYKKMAKEVKALITNSNHSLQLIVN